jgi:hypothetical protein
VLPRPSFVKTNIFLFAYSVADYPM